MASHALLSASGAYRWLACTPSPRFEQEFKDRQSPYALEGTIAHAVAEFCLKQGYEAADVTVEEVPELAELKVVFPEHTQEEMDHEIKGMSRHVQSYVDYVLAIPGTRFVEVRVDFSHLVPEGFGTSDAVILDGGTVHVVDLKYGKGIKVFADGPQGKLYALGALREFGSVFDRAKEVVLHIVQPRLDHVDSHRMPIEQLHYWADHEVRPKAKMAFIGQGEFVPGDHCGFCRAAAVCKARAEYNLRLAFEDFAEPCPDPRRLTIADIAGLLPKLGQMYKWAEAVEAYAMEQALADVEVPGYKLVEGRSNRKWTDEGAVADAMRASGLTNEQIYTMKLVGITEAEKLLGKKSEIFELAERVPGKPALVPVSDKRPPLNVSSAARDFAETE